MSVAAKPFIKVLGLLLLMCCWSADAKVQAQQNLDLTVIVLNVSGNIPNEPKIDGTMEVYLSGGLDAIDIVEPDLVSNIGIELRGNGSLFYAKSSYRIETRDEDGENRNLPLLGMSKENDWILHASYIDASFMRNAITYEFAETVSDYAADYQHCQVILNGEYIGLYILYESIKRDDNRVATPAFPDDSDDPSEGSYIFKTDVKWGIDRCWLSEEIFQTEDGYQYEPRYSYVYPKRKNITDDQREFMQDHLLEVDRAIWYNEEETLESIFDTYLDLDSFVEFIIINEFGFNPDAYRLSSYFHWTPNGENNKIIAGPIWDFNVCYSNYFQRFGEFESWDYDNDWWEPHNQIPFWWPKFMEDPYFLSAFKSRYIELRNENLNAEWFNTKIDSLTSVLAPYIDANETLWPNDIVTQDLFWASTLSFGEDVESIKSWIPKRLHWMDQQVDKLQHFGSSEVLLSPNPASSYANVRIFGRENYNYSISVFNFSGQKIDLDIEQLPIQGTFRINTTSLSPGMYFVSIFENGKLSSSEKLILNPD